MLFNLNYLYNKYKMNVTGLIHVGIHEGGEIETYASLGIKNAILIEANPSRYQNLVETLTIGRVNTNCSPLTYKRLPDHLALITKSYIPYNFAVIGDDTVAEIDLNITSHDGGMDSIFKLNNEGASRSWCGYRAIGKIKVPSTTLDNLVSEKHKFNFLNIDAEGAELDILIGSKELLKYIDYIIVETQDVPRFDNTATSNVINKFLTDANFEKMEYHDTGIGWGDAFYIKK